MSARRLESIKISADGVFSRLEELQLHHTIQLSELPLAGKIRAVYQSIGGKSQVQTAAGRKRRRHQGEEGKAEEAQGNIQCLIWKRTSLNGRSKYELEVYLSHHHMKKTGNKPELVSRVKEHMHTEVH